MLDRRARSWKDEDGKIYVEGAVFLADTPNVNGITYPKAVLEKMAEEAQAKVKAGVLFVTVGLYGGPSNPEQMGRIPVKDVAMVVRELRVEDGALRAKAEVLNTANGRALRLALKDPTLGDVSMAGTAMGSLKNDVVQGDAVLVSMDLRETDDLLPDR